MQLARVKPFFNYGTTKVRKQLIDFLELSQMARQTLKLLAKIGIE